MDVLNKNTADFGNFSLTIYLLAACIGKFEDRIKGAKPLREYAHIQRSLNDLLLDLSEYLESPASPSMARSIANIDWGITSAIDPLISAEIRNPNQAAEAKVKADQVLGFYRRVLTLLGQFALNESPMVWKIEDEQMADTLLAKLRYSAAAQYHSSESEGLRRNGCAPNTRTDLLHQLQNWARYKNFERIYWLNGRDGTGKTTIAYSLCEYLETTGMLSASFFCSRQLPICRDASRILPTISYQLALCSRPFRWAVSYILERNPDVYNQPIHEQFKKLIVIPLHKVRHTFLSDAIVVIDAIEECEDRDEVHWTLNALFKLALDMPVKLLVTSLPESDILGPMWNQQDERFRSKLCLDELQLPVVQGDIRTYLTTKLEGADLSPADLESLVELSGGSFLYATIAGGYILGDDISGSGERLDRVLRASAPSNDDNNHHNLDYLLTVILNAVFDDGALEGLETGRIILALHTMICAREPPPMAGKTTFLGFDNTFLTGFPFRSLFPVLYVSEPNGVVFMLHESFRDFMLDQRRSGVFRCDAGQHNARLAQLCFEIMKAPGPPLNICNLESSYLLDREIPDLEDRVGKAISLELLYACRYWAGHLERAQRSDEPVGELHSFLSERLLLWMEVLNLKGCISEGARALHSLQKWLQTVECTDSIWQFVEDACSFVTAYASSPASNNTPHIYVSALAFWPEDSPISRHYMQKLTGLPRGIVAAITLCEGAPFASSGATIPANRRPANVTHILPRPSGRAIRMLDEETDHLKKLEGHADHITSIAYSPNGAYLVSSFHDDTIRIWDADTGWSVGKPLIGHESIVYSVAYSPDGARIVSGSEDRTVRIWDAHTGQQVGQPLMGHRSWIRWVAYSPDDAYIISGSGDETIGVWDALTGRLVRQLECRLHLVNSVACSPDGAHIASCSRDETIRIWDPHTGQQVGQPFKGHRDWVLSMAYSPDGAYLASGSSDHIVRIWDARTGQRLGQLLHRDWVWSVVYSPDGAYIISGCDDGAVHIWDAHTGQLVGQPLKGHTDIIRAVACSPNGAFVASGSDDHTIRIFKLKTTRTTEDLSNNEVWTRHLEAGQRRMDG
ncbi:hypothetical protein FRC08_005024 [Ceratobasidium sp. 394]|nr:hypothetical protein FRC08_005024 [Ceratobasidium sp. 394]